MVFIYLTAPDLSCGMWDLAPCPGIEPRPPALGAQSLSHWTTREVPKFIFLHMDTDIILFTFLLFIYFICLLWLGLCCCVQAFSRRRRWHPTPVLLPGKPHGRRSLEGCSPWGCKESDTTERLHFHFSLSCIGEGNGNPLQCSCLEHPRDSRAWWAAVYGVAQSRTRLKRLSSSSKIGEEKAMAPHSSTFA